MNGPLWALVPLKQLARGKERLADTLDAPARRALITAMAEDVVSALLAVPLPAQRILLVSDDEEVIALAARLGVGLFRPSAVDQDPLNAALEQASCHALGHGAGSVLVLHADLPLAEAAALAGLLEDHARHTAPARATLVADRAGQGTNCLVLTPPGALRLRFGADSRARHRGASGEAGVDYREFRSEPLAFDVDFPEDLGALVRLCESPDNACGARTREWMAARAAKAH